MSIKGGHSLEKHGGAQDNSHGSTVFLNDSVNPAETNTKDSYFSVQSVGEESEVHQDGGHLVSMEKVDQGLGELLASGPTSGTEEARFDLGGLDTAVTLSATSSNAEWLKTKLGNLGGVFLIQSGVTSLDKLGVRDVTDVGTILTADKVVTDTQDLNQVRTSHNVSTPLTVATNGSKAEAIKSQPSSLTLPNTQLTVTEGRGQHQSLSCRTGDNEGKEASSLSDSYKSCVEDMDKASTLILQNDDDSEGYFESNEEEFHVIEFPSLNNDKSNTLMTPQELELMPERGKEFEESVGPKEHSRPITPVNLCMNSKSVADVIADSSNPTSEPNALVLASPLSLSNSLIASNSSGNGEALTVLSSTNEGENPTSTVLDQVSSVSWQDLQQQNTLVTNPEASAQQSGGIATISIATDSSSNSTQILINTPQGQQIFQINTAELNKATTALQPLSLQGGLVGKDVNGKIVNAGTVDGITVEDGYLVIPVNASNVDGTLLGCQGGAKASTTDAELSDDSNVEDPTSAPGRVWMCQEDGCDKIFTKLSKLKVHLMRHTGERPFKCSMPDCDWAFTTAYKLKRHEESHRKKKEFVCDYPGCGRRFTTIYNLNTHRKLHERPCTEECPECGRAFPTMRKLDLHMKNHIGAQKTYKCPIEGCNKMFFSPHCMGSHTRVHQEDRDLTCHFEGCGKVYDKLCRLKQHMRTHTGEKPYVCNMESCGWAFSTASKLKRHQRKHTGERKWVCPVDGCSKAFMRAEHLKGHLVTHSGERPFICQVKGCGARFTAKSSMYVHIKKHNEADKKVQYFCPLDGCVKKFNSKTALRAHIAKHYQNALAQANTGDLNSLIPILSPEDIQEGLEGLMAAQVGELAGDASSQDAIVASVNSILPPDAIAAVDQAALISGDDGALTEASVVPDLYTQSVSPSMVTQLVVAGGLPPAASGEDDVDIPGSTSATGGGGGGGTSLLTVNATSTVAAAAAARPATSVVGTSGVARATANTGNMSLVMESNTEVEPTLFAADLDPSSLLTDVKPGGSARTDYRSNRLLVDRAKKRRRHLKASPEPPDNNATSSVGGSSSSNSSSSSGGGGGGGDAVDLNQLQADVERYVPTSAADPFPGGDLVNSAAITFRDPETGAIYVQTQLLQDDPLDPELYTTEDSASLDAGGGSSVLATADLPATLFQDSHVDPDDDDAVEFTSTTINLQDLA